MSLLAGTCVDEDAVQVCHIPEDERKKVLKRSHENVFLNRGLFIRICEYHFDPGLNVSTCRWVYEMSRDYVDLNLSFLSNPCSRGITLESFNLRMSPIISWLKPYAAASSVQFVLIHMYFNAVLNFKPSSELGQAASIALKSNIVPLNHIFDTGPIAANCDGEPSLRLS